MRSGCLRKGGDMTLTLADFQDGLAEALWTDEPMGPGPSAANPPTDWLARLAAQPGFAVYRNTVLKGCVDALRANFPTVERLVGAEWMSAAARVFAQQCPPTQPQLVRYGERFADFLERFEPARDLPYIAEVARLDQLWLLAFAAPEHPRLGLHTLSSMAPAQLAELRLRPSAAAHWHWSGMPAFTLWRCNREGAELPDPLVWQGEGTLLCRRDNRVVWQPLSLGGCAFLDACADGHTLASASDLALEAQPALDFNALLAGLFAAQVFAAE
ncbi:conserved hypothetical protein [Pseudomonas sp. 9Ag]|nr:conserved hypothetical protein [Pseudomonas sp. 9Ag]